MSSDEKVAVDEKSSSGESFKNNRVIAREIARKLGETGSKPRRQINHIVNRLGVDFAQKVLQDTMEIEANGGMLVQSGDRRRTPGGIFFHIAREQMSDEVRAEIFYTWRAAAQQIAAREAKYPPFQWDDRVEVIGRGLPNKGVISEVRINLIGRPGEIERRQNLVITTMQYQFGDALTLPNGVPQPPADPVTYTVYISSKQWERVGSAVQKSDDELIVEGLCAYDAETDSMAVFATFVTTRKLQRKDKKQNKRAAEPDKKAEKQPAAPPESKKAPKQPRNAVEQVIEEAPTPVVEIDIPPGVPSQVAQKLVDLHTAAATFRQKIEALTAKPAGQQFGLEMTQKLLKNTEKQIEALEKQYVSKA